MAREIKLTTDGVRNIPDALASGEIEVIAARWQSENGVRWFARDVDTRIALEVQADAPTLPEDEATVAEFSNHLMSNYGFEVRMKAL